jgi:alpha-tubulin suppressor-like RCC1 family protein
MKTKDNHFIFSYLYNVTSQCDDILLLIQDYTKSNIKANTQRTTAGGHQHIAVLLQNNTVKCWGQNAWGQCDVPDSVHGKVISVSSGSDYTCVILKDNTVKCWGQNRYGNVMYQILFKAK